MYQQVNHVLHPARNVPMGQPDLRHTNLPNVPYRSDTLKANLERVSIGAAPPTTRGLQELVRMSDWDHEFKRTAIFCSAYFISWIFGRTLMVVTAFFVVLICFPFTRRLIFPNVSGSVHTCTNDRSLRGESRSRLCTPNLSLRPQWMIGPCRRCPPLRLP